MTSALRKLLAQYRDVAKNPRAQGTYFERLAIVFIQRDPGMSQEYEDAWDYAIETVDDPAYPLKLFQRVITVSLETMKIVRSLPTRRIARSADGGCDFQGRVRSTTRADRADEASLCPDRMPDRAAPVRALRSPQVRHVYLRIYDKLRWNLRPVTMARFKPL